jgi:hypothetical protein
MWIIGTNMNKNREKHFFNPIKKAKFANSLNQPIINIY